MFLDFAALKEAVSFASVVELLDLKLKRSGNQWRGPCPACNSGGDRALVVTEGKGFFCFALKRGGDQIALAAHVLDLPARDAAQELAERAGIVAEGKSTSTGTRTVGTVPESEGVGGSKLSPLSYLEHDHEAVHAVGFDPEKAKAMGIGYAPRGIMRGTVAIPIRDEHGTLLGYIGVTDATLPSDFKSNVIALKRA
jgi:DNA primase